MMTSRFEGPGVGADLVLHVANEFSEVTVRKLLTPNGERLQITASRIGRAIELDPLQLEGITWQTPESLSRFLEKSFE